MTLHEEADALAERYRNMQAMLSGLSSTAADALRLAYDYGVIAAESFAIATDINARFVNLLSVLRDAGVVLPDRALGAHEKVQEELAHVLAMLRQATAQSEQALGDAVSDDAD